MQKEPENCMTKQESKVDVLNRLRILLMSKEPSGSFNQMWLAPGALRCTESLGASPCHGFSITQLQFQVKPRELNLTEKLQNISKFRKLRPQSRSGS